MNRQGRKRNEGGDGKRRKYHDEKGVRCVDSAGVFTVLTRLVQALLELDGVQLSLEVELGPIVRVIAATSEDIN